MLRESSSVISEAVPVDRALPPLSSSRRRLERTESGRVGVTHASKTESPRQEGPVVRVSERAPVLSAKRRWVPPSTLRHQDALAFESENDPIFRKVRGLLNKLTPEKFQKLSNDLLNIGLDTETIIRGVIILIFDKALDEPNYSSMYAQLCKRLAEVVPNFEKKNESCTFCILLLNKCRTEFENRSAITNTFDQHGGTLSPEDEERRYVAKSKMLGNIKFIGELAKLEILPESIVRKCILQLLEKSRQALDQQDLECLAQLFRTCGRILDTEKARGLMDQYFERMEILSKCEKLTPRIRFMLRDLIDLRKNGWVPRKAISTEGPVPIQQLRADEDLRSGYGGRGGGGGDRRLQQNHNSVASDTFFRHNLKTRGGIDEFLLPHSLNAPDLIHLNSHHDKYQFGSNGYGSSRSEGRDGYRSHRNQGSGFNNYNQRQQGAGFNKHQNNNVNAKDLAPRFKKVAVPGTAGELRPAANSLVFKANNMKPQSFPLQSQSGGLRPNSSGGGGGMNEFLPAPLKSSAANLQNSGPGSLLKEPAITIKQAQDKASKAKKDKGPNREEILKKVATILDDLTKEEVPQEDKVVEEKANGDGNHIDSAVAAYIEIKVPDKIVKDVPFTVLNYALEKSDAQAEECIVFLAALKKGSLLTTPICTEGFRSLAAVISQREASTPRIGTAVAQLLTNSIQQGLTTLAEIASLTENGTHYPLFLLVLQQMNKTLGKQPLTELYNDSKVNLMSLLPTSERTKERLAEILEERGLSFLFPLLRIQAELSKQLQADPNPTQFYKWIKENLDATYHTDPGFINALVTVLIKYINQESTATSATAVVTQPDKSLTLTEKESSLLERYAPVLRSFLHQNLQLQLMALHSLQVYCYSLNFPKGMLLKWFMALYDTEICEEEAFFMWKEDITDAYPGKGNALFQVNSWLVWLQNAESASDETDD